MVADAGRGAAAILAGDTSRAMREGEDGPIPKRPYLPTSRIALSKPDGEAGEAGRCLYGEAGLKAVPAPARALAAAAARFFAPWPSLIWPGPVAFLLRRCTMATRAAWLFEGCVARAAFTALRVSSRVDPARRLYSLSYSFLIMSAVTLTSASGLRPDRGGGLLGLGAFCRACALAASFRPFLSGPKSVALLFLYSASSFSRRSRRFVNRLTLSAFLFATFFCADLSLASAAAFFFRSA